jgi:hypothetical protein
VGIATDCGLDGLGGGIRVPIGTGKRAHPASSPVGTGGCFPKVEADHSLPPSAEVKNMWIYTSTPPFVFMA